MAAMPYGPAALPRVGRLGPYAQEATEELSTVWMGNLPPNVTQADLLAELSEFGVIINTLISGRPAPSGALSGFVRFATRAEASALLCAASVGKVAVLGSLVTCEWARRNSHVAGHDNGGRPRHEQVATAPMGLLSTATARVADEELATLWVGDLPDGTTEESVISAFSAYGQVLTAVVQQRPSPMGSFCGFVRFASHAECEYALSLCLEGRVFVLGVPVLARWATENTRVDRGRPRPFGSPPMPTQEPPIQEGQPLSTFVGHVKLEHHFDGYSADGEELTTLWLGDLPEGTTEGDVAASFAQGGQILVSVSRRPSSRGYYSGFIRFPTRGEAELALSWCDAGHIITNGVRTTARWARKNTKVGFGGEVFAPNSYPAGSCEAPPPPTSPPPMALLGMVGSQPPTNPADILLPDGEWDDDYGVPPVESHVPGVFPFSTPVGMGSVSHLAMDAPMAHENAFDTVCDTTSYDPALHDTTLNDMVYETAGAGETGLDFTEELATLWLGDLPQDTSEADIATAFSPFGQILVSVVHQKVSALGSYSGFIRFSTRAEAELALSWCGSGHVVVKGLPVIARWASGNTKVDLDAVHAGFVSHGPKAQLSTTHISEFVADSEITTLWLGNLPEGTTNLDITTAFSGYGRVLVAVVQQRPSPQGSYSGFARFATREEGEKVLELCNSGSVTAKGLVVTARWAKGNTKLELGGGSSRSGPAATSAQTQALRAPAGTVRTLFLGSLPVDATEVEVLEAFQLLGLDGRVNLCPSRASSRGLSGFIKFPTLDAAVEAFQICSVAPPTIRGHQVVVNWAKQDSSG